MERGLEAFPKDDDMSLTGVLIEPFTLALLSLVGSWGSITLGCPVIHRRLVRCGYLGGAIRGYEIPIFDNIVLGVREHTRTFNSGEITVTDNMSR